MSELVKATFSNSGTDCNCQRYLLYTVKASLHVTFKLEPDR